MYNSQSTYILPNPHYKTCSKIAPFVYMEDRWNYTNTDGTSKATLFGCLFLYVVL